MPSTTVIDAEFIQATPTDKSQVRKGRLDDLILAVADRVVRNSDNPMIQAMYGEYRPLIQAVVRENLSPNVLRGKRRKKPAQRRKPQ